MTQDEALTAILKEVKRAMAKHPNWPGDIIYASAIVQEECGELMRAAVQFQLEDGPPEAVTKEAIQTAATCIRLLMHS